MTIHEAHVERLLGKKVRDREGEVVGRLQEIVAETVDGEVVVLEYHLGAAAMLERVGVFLRQLPYFKILPFPRRFYRVRWDEMDLSEPAKPKIRKPKSALERVKV